MAHVRKISHAPRVDGSVKTSWRATRVLPDGKRQSKNFAKKGEAEAWLRSVIAGADVGASTMTLAELARAHLQHVESLVRGGLRESTTADGYATALSRHLEAHSVTARTRLCDLTTPKLQAFLDATFERTGSVEATRRMRKALVAWCKFGRRKGWMLANPAEACVVEDTARVDDEDVFVIPPKAQLTALLAAAGTGANAVRDEAIVRLLMFAGLRISELLGLSEDAVVLGREGGEIRVRERLERRYATLGRPKSARGRRTVPIGPASALAIRTWRLQRGQARDFHTGAGAARVLTRGRLFTHPAGGPLWPYQDFLRQCWRPLMDRAGLLDRLPDAKGKNRPVTVFSPHALRHVAVSLWIEQGLKPKKVQELVGHSTLQLTMDTYGHLWRDEDEDAALAAASERLIG